MRWGWTKRCGRGRWWSHNAARANLWSGVAKKRGAKAWLAMRHTLPPFLHAAARGPCRPGPMVRCTALSIALDVGASISIAQPVAEYTKPTTREAIQAGVSDRYRLHVPALIKTTHFHRYFDECYAGMSDAFKWSLPSGRTVEDILHKSFRDAPKELLIHSWVIDIDDAEVRDCFTTTEEWTVVLKAVPEMPKGRSSEVFKSISMFAMVLPWLYLPGR